MRILLEEYRLKRKLNQVELSKLSGVPQPMISMIESKKVQNPTLETIFKLANALKCTVDDLIVEEVDSA